MGRNTLSQSESVSLSRTYCALFGAFGGALPTVIRLFQLLAQPDALRPAFSGLLDVDAAIVAAAHLGSAAVLAAIFPYPARATAWLATTAGAPMPALVGVMSAAATHLLPATFAWRGGNDDDGASVTGLVQLLALF